MTTREQRNRLEQLQAELPALERFVEQLTASLTEATGVTDGLEGRVAERSAEHASLQTEIQELKVSMERLQATSAKLAPAPAKARWPAWVRPVLLASLLGAALLALCRGG